MQKASSVLTGGTGRTAGTREGTVLDFEHVTLTYGMQEEVLVRAHFAVREASSVAITGESGAGKSTILAAAIGLLVPAEGHVHALGRRLDKVSRAELAKIRAKIGFVFQNPELFPEISPEENVALAARIAGFAAPDSMSRAKELLRQLEVPLGRTFSDELSGGERQRVALARALIVDPELIVVDEPTASLDPRSASLIVKQLSDAVRVEGRSLLIATHDPQLARIADTRWHIQDHMLTLAGSPANANSKMTEP